MTSWWRSPAKWIDPAYLAALALVAIQVAMGILFKIVQHNGRYEFSTSAAITLSEFGKLCLSSIFFYRTCMKRHADTQFDYAKVAEEESTFLENDTKETETGEGTSTRKQATSFEITLDESGRRPAWHSGRFTPITYFQYCKNELDVPAVMGYGHLALLYAFINNTVFVLFILSDPGTIQLVKSGITFVTAAVSFICLSSKIVRTQWVAIAFQITGLIITQYHEGSGATYPVSTYAILFMQTFIAAVSGVYNQHLCKSQKASMHAQNMCLYTFGVFINAALHMIISFLKPSEPSFFDGFDNIGAILVIISSILNGLIITAVYKYADAIIKCFATAVSTAILLFLGPLLFHAHFSFLIIPGTVIVFGATWLYLDASPPKSKRSDDQTQAPTKRPEISTLRRIFNAFLPSGMLATIGLFFIAILIMSAISILNVWESRAPTVQPPPPTHHDAPVATLPSKQQGDSEGKTSPFANTMAFIRWNKYYPQRFQLLSKYEPFFHTLHYSVSGWNLPMDDPKNVRDGVFYNMTHDNYAVPLTPHLAMAQMMQVIEDDPDNTLEGILYYHMDAWIDPMEFAFMDFERIWFPGLGFQTVREMQARWQCYIWPEQNDWVQWERRKIWKGAIAGLSKIDNTTYNIGDGYQVCTGWSDIYYVPRKYFRDFIALATKLAFFHEAALPTLMHIIDQTYREKMGERQVLHLADCWGGCCSKKPNKEDILFHRCGHKMNYLRMKNPVVHYDKLDQQAALLAPVNHSPVYHTPSAVNKTMSMSMSMSKWRRNDEEEEEDINFCDETEGNQGLLGNGLLLSL